MLKKDQELAGLKEKVANLSVSEINLKDDVDSQRIIVQRQKEIIEGLREELDSITKKLAEVTKLRDKAIEEATIYKMKNMERERFLSKEAQMSMEIEDLQRELNKQRLILNGTSMAKLADTVSIQPVVFCNMHVIPVRSKSSPPWERAAGERYAYL